MPTSSPADGCVRIAMWSGPRNLSTAMMRSFGSRADCAVIDEPFYASFLRLTGTDHPMREEIIADQENDWREVARHLAVDTPGGRPVFYQKHMTHHMVPEIGRDWMDSCCHAFLIRHPNRVLASYARKRERPEAADIGFLQQAELFDRVADRLGTAPPVVDADDILADARGVLKKLCEGLGIAFDGAMLEWESGGRPTDGIWARHWYDAVRRSTGFAGPSPMPELSDAGLLRVAEATLPVYERLRRVSLR